MRHVGRGVEIDVRWWRLAWSQHGKIRWAVVEVGGFRWGLGWIWILMGLFEFLLWIFVFWVQMGWILDYDGLDFGN